MSNLNDLVRKEDGSWEVDGGIKVLDTQLIAKEFDRENRKVVQQIKRQIEDEAVKFEEGKHYYRIEKSKITICDPSEESQFVIRLFPKQTNHIEAYLLTERGFNKTVMSWRGKKADEVKEHILDIYFRAKEILTNDSPVGIVMLAEQVALQGKLIAEAIKEMDTRISAVEKKVETKPLNLPTYKMPPRKHFTEMVKGYCGAFNQPHKNVYSDIYREFNYRYNKDTGSVSREMGMSQIEYIEHIGMLDELILVATQMIA